LIHYLKPEEGKQKSKAGEKKRKKDFGQKNNISPVELKSNENSPNLLA